MDSFDPANLLSGDSRLLSQSPQFSFNSASSSSHTGPGGDDLSLSELYPDSDHRLPKTRARPSIAQALGFGAPVDQSDDLGGKDADKTTVETKQSCEEKLQNDLFVLRQLNGAFAVYNDALREAQGGTEVKSLLLLRLNLLTHSFHKHIAEQLEQTDALLNKYINILSKTEQFTRLIFDERWMGAEAVCGLSLISFRDDFFLKIRLDVG